MTNTSCGGSSLDWDHCGSKALKPLLPDLDLGPPLAAVTEQRTEHIGTNHIINTICTLTLRNLQDSTKT